MDLVERIKALCSERGITLNQMEKELGLKGTVARWQEHEPSVGKVRLVAQFFGMTVSELIEDHWTGIDMTDAWEDDETEKPAAETGDGWKDAIRALPPDLLGLLSDFVQLAKESPETAKRYLAFAVQELRSQQ